MKLKPLGHFEPFNTTTLAQSISFHKGDWYFGSNEGPLCACTLLHSKGDPIAEMVQNTLKAFRNLLL